MSINTLVNSIKKLGNPSVAGLDARIEYVPEHVRAKHFVEGRDLLTAVADAIFEFNCALIDALYDIVPAVKPQSAYYELLGPAGSIMLKKTIDYAKSRGMYVILDGKRNDIGATAEAYADAYLGKTLVNGVMCEPYGADCLTVNAYLGTDGIAPFLKRCGENGKGIFVLVKTSNPSSGEFQDRLMGDKKLCEEMAKRVGEWGSDLVTECGYSEVGAVVGATYPKELSELRAYMPKNYFLVPGYGAQGGKASDVANAFNDDGLGAIINSSRGIMCAWKKTDGVGRNYAQDARNEAIRMRDEIVSFIK